MEKKDTMTFHVQVFGKVQGVFFRDCTKQKADELKLVGWVRNCSDGSVQSVISGKEADVNKMIDWFHTGSPHSRVDKVTFNKIARSSDMIDFQITY